MRHKRNITIILAISILFGSILGIYFRNSLEIDNLVSQNKSKVLKSHELTFYNWENTEDNVYVSQGDPQIIIKDINQYVNNIMLVTSKDISKLKPEIYYTDNDEETFGEGKKLNVLVTPTRNAYTMVIDKKISSIRIDLLNEKDYKINIEEIIINPTRLTYDFRHMLLTGVFLFIILMFAYSIWIKRFSIIGVFYQKEIIITMLKNDLKMRYAGSVLGILWAFIQPLMTILVLWFVFQYGLKNMPINDTPFILWLITGYVPWLYFSDGLASSAGTFNEYSYLVKKVKFQTSIVPFIKILSSTLIHVFFIIFIFFMYSLYGFSFSIISFQILYYSFALFILLLGLSWLVSSISVFFKDFGQIVSVLLQVGFWATPVLWNPEIMAPSVADIIKLNPIFYIVQGYRDSFITGNKFYEYPEMTLYYWGVTLGIFVLGLIVYRRLRPHFADVL